jgi:hypothetical protein
VFLTAAGFSFAGEDDIFSQITTEAPKWTIALLILFVFLLLPAILFFSNCWGTGRRRGRG